MKRILTFAVLIIMVIVSTIPTYVIKAATLISDVNDLQNMSADLTDDYQLANNIDATATVGWNLGDGFIPIGTIAFPFTGTFDGNGFVIDGLVINTAATVDPVGLFGAATGATLSSINMTNVNITGNDYVGTLVGFAVSCVTSNCTSSGSVSNANSCVGGLIGYDSNGHIYDSGSTCSVSMGSELGGGFVGNTSGSYITRCYSTGNVTTPSTFTWGVGGFVGMLEGSTVTECYALGDAIADSESDIVGGFVGAVYTILVDDVLIQSCYARGDVSGQDIVGGFAGQSDGLIDKCYSTGSVNNPPILGETYVGGFLGETVDPGRVTASVWDKDTSGKTTGEGGTYFSTAQMKTLLSYGSGTFDSLLCFDRVSSTTDLKGQDAAYAIAHSTGVVDGIGNLIGQWWEIAHDYIIHRAASSYNTTFISSLAGPIINDASFDVQTNGSASTNFTIRVVPSGNITSPLVDADYYSLSLQNTDYGTFDTDTDWNPKHNGSNVWINLNAAGVAAINTSGVSTFGFRSENDINSIAPIDNEYASVYTYSSRLFVNVTHDEVWDIVNTWTIVAGKNDEYPVLCNVVGPGGDLPAPAPIPPAPPVIPPVIPLGSGSVFDYTIPIYTEWFNIHYPSAQGNYSEWTGTYVDVDDKWKNYNDNNYIVTSTASANVSFLFTKWRGTATISSVSVVVRAKKVFTADSLELYYYSGGSSYIVGSLDVSGSFTNLSTTLATNPATGIAWTISDINNMQWLLTKTGSAGFVYVSQIYVQVIPTTIEGQTSLSNLGLYTEDDDLDIQNIINSGFASSSFLDTYLTDVNGYMPVTDKLGFEISSISAFETKTTNLRLSYDPPQTNFAIIPGYSGNITTLDNDDLEPGTSFNITISGYIDTSAAMIGQNIFLKTGALQLYVQAAGNLRAILTYAAGTITVDNACTTGLHTIIVSADTANFTLYVDGVAATASQTAPGAAADANFSLNGAGDYNNIVTLFGAATHWEAVNTDDAHTSYVSQNTVSPGQADVYAVTDWPFGAVSSINHVHVYTKYIAFNIGNIVYAKGIVRLSGNETIGAGSSDSSANWVVATDTFADKPGGGSWTIADITNMQAGMQLYGGDVGYIVRATYVYVTVNYTPWETASVVNTSNNWTWGSNATPYFEHISLTQGAVDRIHYHPVTIISGTILPNIQVPGSYEGAFAYGANPSGITVWVGTTTSTTSYSTTTSTTDAPSHMFISPTDVNSGNPIDVEEELKDLMFYETFRIAGEKLGLSTAAMFSIFLISLATGLGFLASILVGLPIIGIITSAGILSMGLQNQIIPLWFIITFLILAISMLYLKGRM